MRLSESKSNVAGGKLYAIKIDRFLYIMQLIASILHGLCIFIYMKYFEMRRTEHQSKYFIAIIHCIEVVFTIF